MSPKQRTAQTLTPGGQAQEVYVHPRQDILTYPRKVQCQAQRCQPRTHQGRSEWLCWLLSWSLVQSPLPSQWDGMCSLSKSGFVPLPFYQELNYSEAASTSSPPPPFYLELQVSVVNHFLGTSCSLRLQGISRTHIKTVFCTSL